VRHLPRPPSSLLQQQQSQGQVPREEGQEEKEGGEGEEGERG